MQKYYLLSLFILINAHNTHSASISSTGKSSKIDPLVKEFYSAIGKNDLDKVRQMLAQDKSLASKIWLTRSPFEQTYQHGGPEFKKDIAMLLVKYEVDLDRELNLALQHNDYEVVKFLLDHGAPSDFNLIFNYAKYLDYPERYFKLFQKYNPGTNAFITYLKQQYDSLEDALKSLTSDTNQGRKYELVPLLKYLGANIDVKDIDGNTLLIISILDDNKKLVRALLRAGANIYEENNNGESAYSLCIDNAENINPRICELIEYYNLPKEKILRK